MKRRILILTALFALFFVSIGHTQEISKEETLKYIKNILDTNIHPYYRFKFDRFEVHTEYQTLVIQIQTNDGKVETFRHNIRNASLEIEPHTFSDISHKLYFLYINSVNEERKLLASLNSLDDANKLVKAVQHLAGLIYDEKDPFE